MNSAVRIRSIIFKTAAPLFTLESVPLRWSVKLACLFSLSPKFFWISTFQPQIY